MKVTRLYRQAAVIPFRIRDERLEIALVTTPRGKRWVVPKGSLDEGERARDAAIRETEEEAGLIGDLEPKPLGRYRFTRANERYEVEVYLMRVTLVLDYWLEAGLRRRRWIASIRPPRSFGPTSALCSRSRAPLPFRKGPFSRRMTGSLPDGTHR